MSSSDSKSKIDSLNKYFNALKKIDIMCNEHFDAIRRNIYNIDTIMEQVNKHKNFDVPLISANWPKVIYFENDLLFDLYNEQIINGLLSYKMKLIRFNEDVRGLEKLCDFFKTSLVHKKIDSNCYMANFRDWIEVLKKEREFLLSIEKKVKIISALTIILRKRKKRFAYLYSIGSLNIVVNEDLICHEIKGIEDGIRKNIEKSKEEVRHIYPDLT